MSCQACGHAHAGLDLAGICIGCACPHTPSYEPIEQPPSRANVAQLFPVATCAACGDRWPCQTVDPAAHNELTDRLIASGALWLADAVWRGHITTRRNAQNHIGALRFRDVLDRVIEVAEIHNWIGVRWDALPDRNVTVRLFRGPISPPVKDPATGRAILGGPARKATGR